jgi:hypothetical protein
MEPEVRVEGAADHLRTGRNLDSEAGPGPAHRAFGGPLGAHDACASGRHGRHDHYVRHGQTARTAERTPRGGIRLRTPRPPPARDRAEHEANGPAPRGVVPADRASARNASPAGVDVPPQRRRNRRSTRAATQALVEPRVDPVEPRVDPVEPRVDPVEPRVDPVEPRVDPVEPRVDPGDPARGGAKDHRWSRGKPRSHPGLHRVGDPARHLRGVHVRVRVRAHGPSPPKYLRPETRIPAPTSRADGVARQEDEPGQKTWELRQKTWELRQKTWDPRQKMWD